MLSKEVDNYTFSIGFSLRRQGVLGPVPTPRSFALLDLSVLFLELLDAVTDEDEYLAVGRAAFIVGNNMQLVEHLVVNSYGHTLDSHNIAPI